MRATDAVAQRAAYAEQLPGKACGATITRPSRRRDLERGGFSAVDAWLEPSPQTFKDAAGLGDFCPRRRAAQPV